MPVPERPKMITGLNFESVSEKEQEIFKINQLLLGIKIYKLY